MVIWFVFNRILCDQMTMMDAYEIALLRGHFESSLRVTLTAQLRRLKGDRDEPQVHEFRSDRRKAGGFYCFFLPNATIALWGAVGVISRFAAIYLWIVVNRIVDCRRSARRLQLELA